MLWLIGLLALETVLEGLLCGLNAGTNARQRKVMSVICITTLAVVTVLLSTRLWRVWLWSVPFAAYRIVNLLRVYTARLPQARLKAVAWGAFFWLTLVQLALLLVTWGTHELHQGRLLLNTTMALQLLGAVLLLRSTLHTWQHAALQRSEKPLSDRQLPSLSVLVPARNETAALRTCLEALVASDYPKLEILVLYDCSVTRRTPEIIRDFAHNGVRFIQGKLPDETRWLAKNYAYEELVEAASGDLFLFCGVDTIFEPHTIRRLVNILEDRGKNMLSVMPLRQHVSRDGNSLFQTMRYYWELCLPRRIFKRPPVLSTCWLIRREALTKMGGLAAVSHSISPEATFAREAVTTDSYSFIRSDDSLGMYSNKPAGEQYDTSVRVRYPQLHRRLELAALMSIAELVFLLGPFVGLLLAGELPRTLAYVLVWSLTLVFLFVTYGFASVGARLANPWYGWLLMPAAFALDLMVLHISLWKYEFGTVDWKGRNVCLPVMQLTSAEPAASSER
jgi:hypothetical protein